MNTTINTDLIRLTYPHESRSLRGEDTLILKTRSGERKIYPGKWYINRRTSVGEDADLWERRPNQGQRHIAWINVIAVERPKPKLFL